ncbi:MAG: carboxypeptidase-like regulatory domain-containing protein [Bacteroidota bacterium]|nr:carboxypeptidase-like regulatory domain-containing protein [Bacteroidota bacterium]
MKTHNNIFALIAACLMVALFTAYFNPVMAGDDQFSVIRGKLVDQANKKPLMFANIYLDNTGIGTVSNGEGEFILKVPVDEQNHPIKVSYMGYRSQSFNFNDLSRDYNVIPMELEAINIKEVIVRTNDPISLIRGVIKNIPENYGRTPYVGTAFYRESAMQNRQYVGVAEAILSIYKSDYGNEMAEDRIKVFKGRKSQDVKRMDTLVFKLQGGHYVATLLDLAKSPETFMLEKFFHVYNYQPVTTTNIEGRETYVIDFAQRKEIDDAFYTGRLYIDVNTLAIKKAEFSISPYGLKFADQYLVKKRPIGYSVKTTSGHYMVDYREINGKWMLNHVRYEVKFKVDKKRLFSFSKTYTSTVDLAMTDKDTVNVAKFKLRESVKPNDVFIDHVSSFYDEDFWGSYNIIKPEEPIEAAIERIGKRLQKYQK